MAWLMSPRPFALLAALVAIGTVGAESEQEDVAPAAEAPAPSAPRAPVAPRLIGYFDAKRQKDFPVTAIPSELTHVVLMNGVKVAVDGKIHTRPKKFPWEKSAEELIQQLGAQNTSLVLSIRGYPDDDTFDRVAENAEARANFVASLARRAYFWGASGVELEWHSDDIAGGKPMDAPFDPQEQSHFAVLCQELSKELRTRGLTLSVAVRPNRMEFAPDVPVQDFLDWVMIRAFSMRSLGDPHHSSLKDAKSAVGEWLSRGVPASMLVLGTPMFAKTGSALSRQAYHDSPRLAWGDIQAKGLRGSDPMGDTFVDDETGKVWWASGVRTTQEKMSHAIKEGLGGVALRELHHDARDVKMSLVSAAAGVLRRHQEEQAEAEKQVVGLGLFQKGLQQGRSDGRKRHMEEF